MNTVKGIIAGLSLATALAGNVHAAEVTNAPSEITGATIVDFSSEDTTYGRLAANVLNEEGQWLSTTQPAQVTLDLGAYYNIERLHVQNYWEARVPTRLAEIGSTSLSTRTRSPIMTPNPLSSTQTPERMRRERYVFIQPKTSSHPCSPGSGACPGPR